MTLIGQREPKMVCRLAKSITVNVSFNAAHHVSFVLVKSKYKEHFSLTFVGSSLHGVMLCFLTLNRIKF